MPEATAPSSVTEPAKDEMPTMGFLEHLEELRRRIIYSIIAVAVGCAVCWKFVERIVDLMQRPIVQALHANGLPEKLVYLNPVDPFNLYLKVAGVVGLFVASPVVLYQVWLFIAPGLYRHEKRYVLPFMVSTVCLFLAVMGMVTAGWMWRNLRYSILVIFVIAAILTPTTDIVNMCIFAAPMVALYMLSIGIAWLVHPTQRKKREGKKKS